MYSLSSYKQRERRECGDSRRFYRLNVYATNLYPPTGALDYQTGKAILKLLQDTCREKGVTVIVITHNSAIAPMADRVIEIKNGRVENMRVNPNPVSVETIEW